MESNTPSKRELLEQRASKLGIGFNAKTSDEILAAKIEQKLSTADTDKPIHEIKDREYQYKEAMRLVRVIVTPTTAEMREYEGEIFTVSNSLIGTVKRFVPFGKEQGWHIENILYQTLKEKQIQIFQKKRVNGQEVVDPKLIPAFSIVVLPDLTEEELKKLAETQKARQSVED